VLSRRRGDGVRTYYELNRRRGRPVLSSSEAACSAATNSGPVNDGFTPREFRLLVRCRGYGARHHARAGHDRGLWEDRRGGMLDRRRERGAVTFTDLDGGMIR